jgi:3-methyl-2-oxobutanoate hydroxymethyltransferase
MEPKKLTPGDILAMKRAKKPIVTVACYDYPTALLVDRAGLDMILVGDSLGMTVLGYDNTVPVTMDEIVHHTKAVTRAVKRTLVHADMPFMSYNTSERDAIINAGRLMKDGGADAVKLEGGAEMKDTVRAIVRAGIPVVGHIGLTPQTSAMLGGFKVQGKTADAAQRIMDDALAIEDAGAFAIVLEAIPSSLAKRITERLSAVTISVGAGIHCDAQGMVIHDLLGLFDRFIPKFAKRYVNLSELILKALEEYKDDVLNRRFPTEAHSYHMDEKELDNLK